MNNITNTCKEDSSEITVETPPAELIELWQKIITDLKQYDNVTDLVKELDKLKKECDNAMNQFKELIIKLTIDLAHVTGDTLLNRYKDDIITAIKNNPKNVTDSFIMQGYNQKDGYYRKQLVTCNEEFFLNHSFNEFTKGDTSLVDRLFQFKTFWNKLKKENRDIIKYYLLTLCYFADIRYINFNKYLELKKINQTHKKIFDEYDKII
jgi:hypothetical protein